MKSRCFAILIFAAISGISAGQSAQIYQQLYRRIEMSEHFDRIVDSVKSARHFSLSDSRAELDGRSIVAITKNVEGDFVSCDHEPVASVPYDHPVPVSDRFVVTTTKGKFTFPGVYMIASTDNQHNTRVAYYRPFVVLTGEIDRVPNDKPDVAPEYRVYYDFSGEATLNYRPKGQTGPFLQIRIPRATVDEINYYGGSDKSIVFLKPWGTFQRTGSASVITTLSGAGQYQYSASGSLVGAPFGNSGKKQAPLADDRFSTDNTASYTFQMAQAAAQGIGEFSPTSTSGSANYQLNSDNFPFQVVAAASNNWTWGGSRDAVGSVQFLRSGLVDGIDVSFTGEFESISNQAQGVLGTSDLTFHLPNQFGSKSVVSLYTDWQFPSVVEGIAIWDIGLSWKMTDQWSLIGQYNQGGTVTMTVSLSR